MLQTSLHKPILLIDGKRVNSFKSGSLSQSGNKAESLSATFSDPDLEDMALTNKKVEVYLREEDGAPIFRGYIRQFNPSDANISISAQDARAFMSGDLIPIVMDDKDNYDGHTVVQFLKEYIETQVNINETRLSVDTLREMDRPIYMTDKRGSKNPFKEVENEVKKKLDDESSVDRADINAIFKYFFEIIHLGDVSGLTIRKTRSLESSPDFVFSYRDGITSLSYRERSPPSYALATTKGEKQEQAIFRYGNAPLGIRGMNKTSVKGSSRGELRENLISHVILAQLFTKEITLGVSKAFNIGLGNIIRIEVPDSNIAGQYRVTGKSLNVGDSLRCTLKCNNEPVVLSDYI